MLLSRALKGISIIIGCVLVTHCGIVGVDYKRSNIPTPDGWTRAIAQDFNGSSPQIDQWWRSFNDSSLNRLIAKVKLHNKDLKIAAQSISIARLQRGVSDAQLLPIANVSAGASRSQNSEFATGFNVGGSTLYNSAVDASWEADVFGGLRRGVEAAKRNEEAVFESYRDLLVTLYAEAALNYIDYRTLESRIAVANERMNSQQQTLNLTKELLDAGLNSKIDLLQAEADLNTTKAQIPQFRSQLIQTRNRLAVLTGQYPQSLVKLLSRSKSIPSPRSLRSIGLPADLIRARPDVRRAERELAAQTAKIGIAEADLFPKFRLLGQFSLQSKKLGKLVDGRSTAYSFGPSFEWQIFTAGRIRMQIKIEEARTEQSMLNYERIVLVAVEEVENSMAGVAYERDRYSDLNKAYNSSSEATNLVKDNYKEGLIDFQRVLDSERTKFSLKDNLSVSKGEIAKNYVRLYKALGGGTKVSPVYIDTPRTRAVGKLKDRKKKNVKN